MAATVMVLNTMMVVVALNTMMVVVALNTMMAATVVALGSRDLNNGCLYIISGSSTCQRYQQNQQSYYNELQHDWKV